MATHINYARTCPRCEEGINSSELNIKCPTCGFQLGPEVPRYQYPLTMCEQHQKYVDGPAHLELLMSMPHEKAMSIINDSLNIVETASAKNGSVSEIRDMLGIAMRVGEVAKAYLDYLNAGGKHVPDYITIINSRNQENSNEPSPRTREDPSTAE
jgi:hypothetical protein